MFQLMTVGLLNTKEFQNLKYCISNLKYGAKDFQNI